MKGEKIRMKDLAERFHEVGVVPVVVLEDVKDAVPLAQALVEGGLPCAEVTFRTAAAEESIRLMAEKFPENGTIAKVQIAPSADTDHRAIRRIQRAMGIQFP